MGENPSPSGDSSLLYVFELELLDQSRGFLGVNFAHNWLEFAL